MSLGHITSYLDKSFLTMLIPANINKSIALSIGKLKQPVITKYQLSVLIFKSYPYDSTRKIKRALFKNFRPNS